MFGPGEYKQFVTTLVGVNSHGPSVFFGRRSFFQLELQCTNATGRCRGRPSDFGHCLTPWNRRGWAGPAATVTHQTLGSATEKVVQSGDPNDMIAGGFGPQGWIVGDQTIPFTIDFENMPTAAAPAAQVVITDQLSANLDWSTFQLQQIYFNNVEIQVPAGLQDYTTQVYVATDPNPVDVTAAFNPDTGVVTWTMTSINPVTGQEVTDPLAGFLPPDNADFDGSGLVSYTIDPKPGLPTDTQITGQASIVFDVNAAMETPQTLNTVDVTPPTSSVSRCRPRNRRRASTCRGAARTCCRTAAKAPASRRTTSMFPTTAGRSRLAVGHHANLGDLHRRRQNLQLLQRGHRQRRQRPADPRPPRRPPMSPACPPAPSNLAGYDHEHELHGELGGSPG